MPFARLQLDDSARLGASRFGRCHRRFFFNFIFFFVGFLSSRPTDRLALGQLPEPGAAAAADADADAAVLCCCILGFDGSTG